MKKFLIIFLFLVNVQCSSSNNKTTENINISNFFSNEYGESSTERTEKGILKINPGDTREKLLDIMGKPKDRTFFKGIEILFFEFCRKPYADASYGRCSYPVQIENGLITGFGQEVYQYLPDVVISNN